MYHFAKQIELFSDFDKSEYSKFKHGSKSAARTFGKLLASSFIKSEEFGKILDMGKTVVVCSAPHNNIPTASFTLKDYFLAGLAPTLLVSDIEIEEEKIHRKHSYSSEYGEMTAEERMLAISADTFHVDAGQLAGKHVIFVDDCRITGAHESRILSMIEKFNLDITYSFVYYAAVVSEEINPRIENELNHFAVKGVSDIVGLITSGEFVFNTRVVKKILRAGSDGIVEFHCALTSFNFDWGMQVIDTLITLATLNGYHKDETMIESIVYLSSLLRSNELQAA